MERGSSRQRLKFWFSFNQEMSTSARNHSLIQRKKNILSIAPSGIVSHISKNSTLSMSRIIPSSNFCWKGCRCSSAASRLKCPSMTETLDLHYEFANTKNFCLFHNCMWHSTHSEINVHFLAVWQLTDGLIVHSSQVSRVELICVYVFVCVFVFIQTFNRHWRNFLRVFLFFRRFFVRGSYSARVPRSSLVALHREFVPQMKLMARRKDTRRKDRMIREKMDSKKRKVEKSKRIKHTTRAHADDSWNVMCARQTNDLSHASAC